MKKVLNIFFEILLVVISYILQVYVFNITTFWGAKANIILMFIVVVTILKSPSSSLVYAIICGIVSDIMFSDVIFKNLIIYLIVAVVLSELRKTYNSESKFTIIIFSVLALAIYEIISIAFMLITKGNMVNLLTYVMYVIKEILIDVFLAYAIYALSKKLYITDKK